MEAACSPLHFSVPEWERRLSEIAVDKTLVNRLVLDYLVIEGYKDAAEAFARESGLSVSVDLDGIADRMAIRMAVQRGDVQAAVELVNALDPQILRGDDTLSFHLRQQQLIEIIRKGDVGDALLFAQNSLAPAGEANPAFLDEIERTMALLAFEDTAACPVGHLLDNSQRHKTASELNGAILASQSHQREPLLPICLRMLLWSQEALARRNVRFPRVPSDHLAADRLELEPDEQAAGVRPLSRQPAAATDGVTMAAALLGRRAEGS